jgi:uncharacterized protein (TIGR02117 family)
MRLFTLLFFVLLLNACASADKKIYPDDVSLRTVPVYIISHGWHTAIVIEEKYFIGKVSNSHVVPRGRYMMFEWGDGRYFPHEDPGMGLLLRAALLPTSSVIQITGFNTPPNQVFKNSTVVKLYVTPSGISELVNFLVQELYQDSGSNFVPVQAGLYPNSTFFEAEKTYILPRTSNTWTARALHKTGYPIRPFFSFTAGSVIRSAKRNGVILQQ